MKIEDFINIIIFGMVRGMFLAYLICSFANLELKSTNVFWSIGYCTACFPSKLKRSFVLQFPTEM
mgnify:CR=1 FL=1